MEKGGVLSIIVPNDGSLIHNILNDGLNFKKWFYASISFKLFYC